MGPIGMDLPEKGLKTLPNRPRILAVSRCAGLTAGAAPVSLSGALWNLDWCGVADSRHASL